MIWGLSSRRPWRSFALLGLMLLAHPAGAWYKHVASPRYHIVGRASGLLMGVRRSPYLWRRELEEEPREADWSPLPAHGAPQWQELPRNVNAEGQLWTALEHPQQRSGVGLWKGTPSKRTFSPPRHASRGLWAALWHPGAALTPQCPLGCQEGPRRSLSTSPGLLGRALHKQEQPDTAGEAR